MPDEKVKRKSAIDPALLEPIGRITINFAMVEHDLSFFIWQLIGNKQFVGQAVTAQLSFCRLIVLFASLFRLYINDDATLLTELEEIVKSLNYAEKRRNQIIHSFRNSTWLYRRNNL